MAIDIVIESIKRYWMIIDYLLDDRISDINRYQVFILQSNIQNLI